MPKGHYCAMEPYYLVHKFSYPEQSKDTLYIFYLTHYVFTVFKKYTKYRIMLKIVKYDLKMHKNYDHDKIQ